MSVVVMGLDGSGKVRVGKYLAQALDGRFIRGSALQTPAQIAKTARGVPLDAQERAAWLDRIGLKMALRAGVTVVAQSVLTRAERDRLRATAGALTFIHLEVSRDEIAAQLAPNGPARDDALARFDAQRARFETPAHEGDAIIVEMGRMGQNDWPTLASAVARRITRPIAFDPALHAAARAHMSMQPATP